MRVLMLAAIPETRVVVVVRSVVSVAVAAGVGHSVGSHGSVGPGFFSTSPAFKEVWLRKWRRRKRMSRKRRRKCRRR